MPSGMQNQPAAPPSVLHDRPLEEQYHTNFDEYPSWGTMNNNEVYSGLPDSYGIPYPTSYTSSSLPAPSAGPTSQEVTIRDAHRQPHSPRNLPEGQMVRSYASNIQPVPITTTARDRDLSERAEVAKRGGLAKRKQIPPFVQKLSSFLDRRENTDLIRWSNDGSSFIVLDEDEFAKKLIPELFKHNNYASFVRQLNMYGFHKKVGLSDNSMRSSERKTKNPSEYSNPYFRRGHSDLLWLIQKPKSTAGHQKSPDLKGVPEPGPKIETKVDAMIYGDDAAKDTSDGPVPNNLVRGQMSNDMFVQVLAELKNISHSHRVLTDRLRRMEAENAMVKEQAYQEHMKHENSINSIIAFLANFFQLRVQGNSQLGNLYSNMVDPEKATSQATGDPSPQWRPNNQRLLEYRNPDSPGSSGRITTVSPTATTQDDFGEQQQPVPPRSRRPPDSVNQVKNEKAFSRLGPMTLSSSHGSPDPTIHSFGSTPGSVGFPANVQPWALSSLSPQQQSELMSLFTNVTSSQNSQAGHGNKSGANHLGASSLALPSPAADHRHLKQSEDELREIRQLMQDSQSKVDNLRGLLRPLTPNAQGIPPVLENSSVSAQDMNDIFGVDGYFADPDGLNGFQDDNDDPLFGSSSLAFDADIDGILGPTDAPGGQPQYLASRPPEDIGVSSLENLDATKNASRATSAENEEEGQNGSAACTAGARGNSKRRKVN